MLQQLIMFHPIQAKITDEKKNVKEKNAEKKEIVRLNNKGAAPNPSDKQANQPEARAQQSQPEGNKQANNRPRRQGRKNNNEIV